jgi:hypothetical protein
VKRILVAIAIVAALGMGWLAAFWIASAQDNQRLLMRSRATELYAIADLCKKAVAEHYAAQKRMPANEKEAGCEAGTENVAPSRVAGGVVTTVARGKLAKSLTDEGSGIAFTYTPACNGACDGRPIAAWDCKSATTIERSFRPAACR